MKRMQVIGLCIPLLIGILFLTGTVVTLSQTLDFVMGATRTEATYSGSVLKMTANGMFNHPQFRFVTRDGQRVRFTSSSGSTEQPYGDGQKVPVLYDPRHPDQAEIDSFFQLWFGTTVFGLIGLLFVSISLSILVFSLRGASQEGA